MYELLLVSESPRRRQILSDAGFLFSVDTVKISEIIEENVNPEVGIRGLARAKAQAYLDSHKHLISKGILLLSADTMVVLAGVPLGKPKNQAEAEQFLSNLSNKTHSVITGICVYNLQNGENILASDRTEVQFRKLSELEIREYVMTGEPLDKAGAYAIQGGGAKFVSSIRGSIKNVIGLPLELFEKILQEQGWDVGRHTVTPHT